MKFTDLQTKIEVEIKLLDSDIANGIELIMRPAKQEKKKRLKRWAKGEASAAPASGSDSIHFSNPLDADGNEPAAEVGLDDVENAAGESQTDEAAADNIQEDDVAETFEIGSHWVSFKDRQEARMKDTTGDRTQFKIKSFSYNEKSGVLQITGMVSGDSKDDDQHEECCVDVCMPASSLLPQIACMAMNASVPGLDVRCYMQTLFP
eukprot:SAG31_NODE_1527_length_8004_cov_2.107147_6_plen_206_part_00